jgi:hypothetical protein
MQIFYCFYLIVSLALCQQANNPPFKIAITAESPTVVAGAEVSIKVSLTNTSGHDVREGVRYILGGVNTSYQFKVRDEHGRLVPKRTYPHPELGFPGSVNFRTISPGETITEDQEVSALYDMRKPGKYTIQVSRRVSDNPKDDIESNTVTVIVTPKDTVPARKPGKVRHH